MHLPDKLCNSNFYSKFEADMYDSCLCYIFDNKYSIDINPIYGMVQYRYIKNTINITCMLGRLKQKNYIRRFIKKQYIVDFPI